MLNLPDLEQVPAPLRGRRVLSLRFAYPGDASAGEHFAAPLRALAPALIDAIAPLSTSNLGQIHADPEQPGPGWSSGMLLNTIDGAFATRLLEKVGPGTSAPLIGVELRHLGGATAVDVPDGSAAGGRASAFAFTMIGVPNPALFDQVIPAFADELTTSIRPWVSDETAVNFGSHAATPETFATAWPPEIHRRLQAARALYDPERLFTYAPTSD
jgi:hypothetical protein